MPSLTDLKDQKLPSDYQVVPKTAKDKEDHKLIEVREEIATLSVTKDSLKKEIEELNLKSEKSKDSLKSDTEVKKQKIQKVFLLKEIKQLTEALGILQTAHEKGTKDYDSYIEDKNSFINSLSHALDLDAKDQTAKLSKQTDSLIKHTHLIEQISDYYLKYAENLEEEAKYIIHKEKTLNERSEDIEKNSVALISLNAQANDIFRKALDREVEADKYYEEADSAVGFFQGEAENERETLKKTKKNLSLAYIKIQAAEKHNKDKEKALEIKDLQLKDKEQTLKRTADLLRKKGVTI